jgi:hypothetical protein
MKYYVSNTDVIQCVSLSEMPAIRERNANDDDHYLRESGQCRHAVWRPQNDRSRHKTPISRKEEEQPGRLRLRPQSAGCRAGFRENGDAARNAQREERTLSVTEQKFGLYDAAFEKSSCGVGFITRKDGVQTHDVLKRGHEAL